MRICVDDETPRTAKAKRCGWQITPIGLLAPGKAMGEIGDRRTGRGGERDRSSGKYGRKIKTGLGILLNNTGRKEHLLTMISKILGERQGR